MIETVVYTWLAELLARLAARHPNVTVELESADTPSLHERLLKGALDCAITSDDVATGFIENHRIATLAMAWIARPEITGRLPANGCTFADIAAYPIISFQRESPVYRDIAQNAMAGGGTARINYFSSLGAMIGLVRSGYGVALLPHAVVADDIAQGSLRVLKVSPSPSPLPLVASQRAEQASPLVDLLLSMAEEVCDAYVGARPEVAAS